MRSAIVETGSSSENLLLLEDLEERLKFVNMKNILFSCLWLRKEQLKKGHRAQKDKRLRTLADGMMMFVSNYVHP